MLSNYLLIWGKGGHAKVIADNLDNTGYNFVEFIDDNDPISSSEELLTDKYRTNFWHIFVAIGDNYCRQRIYNRLVKLGYTIPTIISPSAAVSKKAGLAVGSFIGPKACINAGALIWNGCIINTCASIDHDCEVHSFTHIAPGTHLCGSVIVGSNCLIGVGTSVIPRVVIQNDVIVAGGSSVSKNLDRPNSLYAGNPAVFKKELSNATSNLSNR